MLLLLTSLAKLCLGLVSAYWLSHFAWYTKTKKQCISVHASWNVPAKYHPFHSSMCVCSCRYLVPFLKFILLGVFVADSINEHLSSQSAFPQGTFHTSACMLRLLTERGTAATLGWVPEATLGPALHPKVWRISPTGTAEGNLHVWNTTLKHSQSRWTHPSTHKKLIQLLKVAKPVWSYWGPYLQLQLSLSQLNPVGQVGETRAKCHHKSRWAEIVSHLCQGYFAWA